jgi:hypothetical protein
MTTEFWIAAAVAIAEACAGVAICVMWHFDARRCCAQHGDET